MGFFKKVKKGIKKGLHSTLGKTLLGGGLLGGIPGLTLGGLAGAGGLLKQPKAPDFNKSVTPTPEEIAKMKGIYGDLQNTIGGRYDTVNNQVLTRMLPMIQQELGARGLETPGGAFGVQTANLAQDLASGKQMAMASLDEQALNRAFDMRGAQLQQDLAAAKMASDWQNSHPSVLQSVGKMLPTVLGTVGGFMGGGGPAGATVGGQVGQTFGQSIAPEPTMPSFGYQPAPTMGSQLSPLYRTFMG